MTSEPGGPQRPSSDSCFADGRTALISADPVDAGAGQRRGGRRVAISCGPGSERVPYRAARSAAVGGLPGPTHTKPV
jgi:hypothetical protein